MNTLIEAGFDSFCESYSLSNDQSRKARSNHEHEKKSAPQTCPDISYFETKVKASVFCQMVIDSLDDGDALSFEIDTESSPDFLIELAKQYKEKNPALKQFFVGCHTIQIVCDRPLKLRVKVEGVNITISQCGASCLSPNLDTWISQSFGVPAHFCFGELWDCPSFSFVHRSQIPLLKRVDAVVKMLLEPHAFAALGTEKDMCQLCARTLRDEASRQFTL